MTGTHHPQNAGALAVTGMLIGVLFASAGCAKDDKSTSPSQGATNSSISGSWRGNVTQDVGGGRANHYLVIATFTQKGDSIGGSWDWNWTETGNNTRLGLKGAIRLSNTITIVETSVVGLNWVATGWVTTSYTGVISSNRDTISLSWITPPPPGSFAIVRQ